MKTNPVIAAALNSPEGKKNNGNSNFDQIVMSGEAEQNNSQATVENYESDEWYNESAI
jgi:hypothetical protein